VSFVEAIAARAALTAKVSARAAPSSPRPPAYLARAVRAGPLRAAGLRWQQADHVKRPRCGNRLYTPAARDAAARGERSGKPRHGGIT
jgi:hypothetical protein